MKLKYKTLTFTEGKSDFHTYIVDGETIKPCICDFNVDFSGGCIHNINPYFRNADEILSGKVLNSKIFSRYDELIEKELERINKVYPGWEPEFRFSKDFTTELNDMNFSHLEFCVRHYQKFYNTPSQKEFLNTFFKSELGLLDGRLNGCKYCYAGYKNNSQKILVDSLRFGKLIEQEKEIREGKLLRTDLEGKLRFFARVGKITECADQFHQINLRQLLEHFLEAGISCVIPSKSLPYSPEMAALFRETGSVAGISVGPLKQEKGACLFGNDNDYRLDNCEKFDRAGVNIGLKINADPTTDFETCQKNGGGILDYKDFLKKHPNVKKQLIASKLHSLKLIYEMTGVSKEQLLYPQKLGIFESNEEAKPRYRNKVSHIIKDGEVTTHKQNTLVPTYIHPEFQTYFGEDMCDEFGDCFKCNSCHLSNMPNYSLDNKYLQPIEKRKGQERSKERKAKEKKEKAEKVKRVQGNLL